MPKKVMVRTAVVGVTANDRRLLTAATAATADPSASSDGVELNRNEFVHLFFSLSGTPTGKSLSALLQIWFYSDVSGKWHKAPTTLQVADTKVETLMVQGLTRLYLQVVTVSGAPILDAWVGLVVPV